MGGSIVHTEFSETQQLQRMTGMVAVAGIASAASGASGRDAVMRSAISVVTVYLFDSGTDKTQSPLDVIGATLGRLWALPNTIIGLAYGGVGMMFGAEPIWDAQSGILHFINMPPWMMQSAMSLGHVHVYNSDSYKNVSGTPIKNRNGVPVILEETLHTRQAEILGPFYLPLHTISMGSSLILGGGTHDYNLLEMGPEMGQSPWPW